MNITQLSLVPLAFTFVAGAIATAVFVAKNR